MTETDGSPQPVGERRWPVALTVLVSISLVYAIPDRYTPGPGWLIPGLVTILFVSVVIDDPGRIDRVSDVGRALSIAMLILLVTAAGYATGRLVYELVHGGGVTDSANALLRVGGVVWVENTIVFALLYWQLDGKGPAARLYHTRPFPDLAFPQHMNPEVRPPGWRPIFADYLYLGITNALAFSPTDVMPLARWAKLTMALQSLVSLAILGLVVARAVNILQ